jgi:hypothetical protein
MVNLSSTTIRLPRLRYLLLSLNDHPRENQRRFPITLEAPNLQCYEEHSDSPDYLTLHDVSSAITEIVLNSTKPRDLRPALNLRTLHLNMESPAGSQILRTLGYDDNVCPKLDHIELYHSGDWCFPAKSAIHCRSFVSGHLIQIVDSDIPFTALNCGYHYKALKVRAHLLTLLLPVADEIVVRRETSLLRDNMKPTDTFTYQKFRLTDQSLRSSTTITIWHDNLRVDVYINYQ